MYVLQVDDDYANGADDVFRSSDGDLEEHSNGISETIPQSLEF
jgi:hypothetical protein